MRRLWSLLLVALVLAAAGCTIPLPPIGPTSVPPPVDSSPHQAQPSTPGFVPAAMPWTDGGPMLWPLSFDDGAGDPGDWSDARFSTAIVRTGFLDASGQAAVAPTYVSFDYCVRSGRPSRVVALRERAVDVLALDGTVTSTIATSWDWSKQWASISCRNDKTVVLFVNSEGDLTWQQVLSLSTGKKLPPEPEATVLGDHCAAPDLTPASKLPDGYSPDVGGWGASGDQETYVNVETQASVQTAQTGSIWCSADPSGFLTCSGGPIPVVYDKTGQVTAFASVTSDWVLACAFPRQPYVWAIAGRVRGYIDADGAWHYQEPVYTTVNE